MSQSLCCLRLRNLSVTIKLKSQKMNIAKILLIRQYSPSGFTWPVSLTVPANALNSAYQMSQKNQMQFREKPQSISSLKELGIFKNFNFKEFSRILLIHRLDGLDYYYLELIFLDSLCLKL